MVYLTYSLLKYDEIVAHLFVKRPKTAKLNAERFFLLLMGFSLRVDLSITIKNAFECDLAFPAHGYEKRKSM